MSLSHGRRFDRRKSVSSEKNVIRVLEKSFIERLYIETPRIIAQFIRKWLIIPVFT